MAYLENNKKFIAVLNKKQPLGQLLNALGHTTAGLVERIQQVEPGAADFLEYPNTQDGFEALISRYPFIVLQSKNGNQIANLRKQAVDASIPHNVFVSAMIGASAEDQLRATEEASGEGLDYMVAVLFGEAEQLDPLTKKFSLFKV